MDLFICISKIFDWMTDIFIFMKYEMMFQIIGYNVYVSLYDILIFLMIFYVLVKYILFRH